MAEERLGASFSIDVTQLKAGLSQANRLIRESESEFKAAAAGLDDWSKSEDGLQAKIKSLSRITDIQKKKVNALETEYQNLITNGLDPASKEAVELRTKINNETAALNKNETELKKQVSAYDELINKKGKAGKATDDVGEKFSGLKTAGKIAVGAIAAVGAAAVGAVSAFIGLGESTKETQTAMAKLDASFVSAFGDTDRAVEMATDTIYGLYGVLGDMDRSVEASNLLAKMSDNAEDLDANTRILTGVFAEFGDSIPTEGLAEGMQATAEMGSVQGVLADALEWQGINLDEYNSKLESLSTAEERAAYIQSTLTDLYGESADAYRENNKALIESNEAQLRMEQSLADLGAIAIPIVTTLKNLASDLLQTITPFVKLMGEGLTGALNGTAGAAENLAKGISGILSTALDKLVEMIPFIIETVVAIIPTIANAIIEKLPDILQLIIDVVTQVINGLTAMLPQIVTAIMDIIPQLTNALIAAIPQLLQASITLLMSIVNALPTIITNLIAALPSVIQTIVDVLISSIPLLIDASTQLFNAIVEAIPTIIQSLTENLPTIIETIIKGLIDAIPLLLDGAITLLMAIVQALPTIIETLVVQVPQIVTTIITTLLSNLPLLIKAAVQLFMGIIKAIPQIVIELVKQMPTIIKAIVKGLKDGIKDVVKVGGDIIRGLWEGIKDMGKWIADKIKGFGESVLGGIKSFFGIKSPSRVMADQVGKNLALGIGMGFEKNIGAVNKEVTEAMNFDDVSVSASATQRGTKKGVVIYQTNNYSQAHSRYEIYKSKEQTTAAVRLALLGV